MPQQLEKKSSRRVRQRSEGDVDQASDDVLAGLGVWPYFIRGPYDSVRKSIDQYNCWVCEGHYHYSPGGASIDAIARASW
jgi:hypothetical protein